MSLWGDDDGAADDSKEMTHGFDSKYRGVACDKTKAKWMAYIKLQGKHHHCGRYEEEEEAAKAYDR